MMLRSSLIQSRSHMYEYEATNRIRFTRIQSARSPDEYTQHTHLSFLILSVGFDGLLSCPGRSKAKTFKSHISNDSSIFFITHTHTLAFSVSLRLISFIFILLVSVFTHHVNFSSFLHFSTASSSVSKWSPAFLPNGYRRIKKKIIFAELYMSQRIRGKSALNPANFIYEFSICMLVDNNQMDRSNKNDDSNNNDHHDNNININDDNGNDDDEMV